MSVSDRPTVHGSGNVISEERPVSGFEGVSISGGGELHLSQGDRESLTIQTDDNLLPLIESDVHGGRLSIGTHHANLHPSHRIRYTLVVKQISSLHLSGSIHAEGSPIRTDRLELSLSGSGQLNLVHLDADAFSTHISGSGGASILGRADSQEVKISGSGNYRAPNLKSVRSKVGISGSGRASIWVTDALVANLSGSGSVEYRGKPRVESHVSGSGRIQPIGQ